LEQQLWSRVCDVFRKKEGDLVFSHWIAPLVPDAISSGVFRILAPSAFIRDWVDSHYRDFLLAVAQKEFPAVLSLDIVVSKPGDSLASAPSDTSVPDPVFEKEESPEDVFLDLGLDPRLTFENFVTGKPNELAYEAAFQVANSKAVAFNPLFLYGGVGLGKTHLMHAIAWHIRSTDPSRNVVYLSAEKFMYQFIRALRHKDIMSFKEKFRSVDVLMIDDVQFISGKDSTQEEFFHTFNALVDQKKQIILSADKSPSDLAGIEERMRSRLGWGLVVDIHPTNYELRLSILEAKVEKMQIEQQVPSTVLEFLAQKITSNIRELEGALNRVVAYANLVGKDLSVGLVSEVLQDLIRSNDRRVSIEEIQQKICDHFSITLAEMLSEKRTANLVKPRQIAMFLSKSLTTSSLPEIGRKFGGKDHTTVIHAVKKITLAMEKSTEFQSEVEMLRKKIQS
jgi:chromosomal replication initiator protein